MQDVVNELKTVTRYFVFGFLSVLLTDFYLSFSFFEKIGWPHFREIFRIYYHGLNLDFSAAAYICALPFLGYCIASFFPKLKLNRKLLDAYTFLVLLLFFVVSFININVYREWGDKISKRAVDAFMASPSGAVASAESTPIFIPILGMIVFIAGAYFLYKRWFSKLNFGHIKPYWGQALRLLLGAFLLFTFIRGGYGRATLNPSKAYFSEDAFYNRAAVSTQWALRRECCTSCTLTRSR